MNKKRFILIDFIFFIVTFIIFIVSLTTINYKSKSDSINNLENYITIASNIYNKESDINIIEETFDDFNKVRITLLSYDDGSVIYDNNKNYNKEENRLDEFVEHNNKNAYYKKSKTTNVEVLYLVKKDNNTNVFIRVGIPKAEVLSLTYNLAIYGSLTLFIINIAFYVMIYFYFRKDILSIEEDINKLNKIVDPSLQINKVDIKELKNTLYKTYDLILEKINEVTDEKNKKDFILNNISQGFIILDNHLNIISINKYALNLFKLEENKILFKNILYLEFGNLIEKELLNFDNDNKSFIIRNNNHYYEFEASKIKFKNRNVIALLIIDISKDKQAETMKRDFFANASHELKSPLTSIIGYQELIKSNLITKKEDLKNATQATLNEALRMKNIVLDMLSLSKLEQNVDSGKEKINIKDVVLEVLNNLNPQIRAKKIKISTDLKDFYIILNKDDAYKLVNNLVSNAINYNKIGGEIYIKLDNSLIIKDTGIGISEEDLPHIFERFYCVDKARTKNNSGTGLGLAIVKHICLNNKFKINVTSKLNEGTTFEINFK